MPTYKVECTLSRDSFEEEFFVDAPDEDAAKKKAEQLYWKKLTVLLDVRAWAIDITKAD